MKSTATRRRAAGVLTAVALAAGLQFVVAADVSTPRPASAEDTAERTSDRTPAYPRVGQPNLYTTDIGRMVRFYRLLGFAEIYRFPLPDGTVAFATLRKGPFYLTLAHYQVIRQSTGLPLGTTRRQQSDITVLVSDVDKMVARLAQHGATVLLPPTDQPWGERQAFVADPEGNYVQLSTHNG